MHSHPHPAPRVGADVEDIDGRIEPTGSLSILAPRRFGHTGLAALPAALRVTPAKTAPGGLESLLNRFRGLGGTVFDTSDETAADRAAQLRLGRWRVADDAIVTLRTGRNPGPGGLSPVALRQAVEATLTRLRRERIDVLYLHGEDGMTPLAESLAAAERLIDSGKVGSLGAAQVSAARLIEARVLASTGLPKLLAVQCDYGILHRRHYETELRIVCAGQELSVSPTDPWPAPPAGSAGRGWQARAFEVAGGVPGWAGLVAGHRARIASALGHVADEQGVAPAVVALAWLLAQRGIQAPVVAATSLRHVDAMMAACAIRLSRTHLRELGTASAWRGMAR
ncbi:MAG TPA: aldo/keto reductase [Microbacteriaceae bacterium]|nr:aldo/keto reductase [Microbacteriaceae bacterium]